MPAPWHDGVGVRTNRGTGWFGASVSGGVAWSEQGGKGPGRAVAHAAVGEVIGRVGRSAAHVCTRLAFEFLALTAARSGEARGERWEEMDVASRKAEGKCPNETRHRQVKGSVANRMNGRGGQAGKCVRLRLPRWSDGPVATP